MKLESGKGRHLEALGPETCRKTKMEDNWMMGRIPGEEGEGIDQDGGQLDRRSTWGGGRGYRPRWRTIGWEEYLGRRGSI